MLNLEDSSSCFWKLNAGPSDIIVYIIILFVLNTTARDNVIIKSISRALCSVRGSTTTRKSAENFGESLIIAQCRFRAKWRNTLGTHWSAYA